MNNYLKDCNKNCWIVVKRHYKDIWSKGTIDYFARDKYQADRIALYENCQDTKGYSYWAIQEKDY